MAEGSGQPMGPKRTATHPHNNNPHTYTNIPHFDRTVRLVDRATEIGGASSASAPLARGVGVLADFPDRHLRIP